MKFGFRLLAVGSLLLVFAFSAQAANDVYSQAPGTVFADTSAVWNNPSDPGFTWSLDQDEEAWAYFTLNKSISFNRIAWYGSNADGNFAVDLYAASCFSCGASGVRTNGSFSTVNSINLLNPSKFSQVDVHKTNLSGNIFSYYIDLPARITLDGTSSFYALSVVNNYTSLPFQWSTSAVGVGSHLRYIVGQAMFLRAPYNLAFTFTDTMAVPVPELDIYVMLIAGLGILGSFVRRQARVIDSPPINYLST